MGVRAKREQHEDHVVLQVLQGLRTGRHRLVGEGGPGLGLVARTQPGVTLVHGVNRGVDQAANCAESVLF